MTRIANLEENMLKQVEHNQKLEKEARWMQTIKKIEENKNLNEEFNEIIEEPMYSKYVKNRSGQFKQNTKNMGIGEAYNNTEKKHNCIKV